MQAQPVKTESTCVMRKVVQEKEGPEERTWRGICIFYLFFLENVYFYKQSAERESGKEGKGGKPGLFSVKEAKGMARRRDINRVQSCREFVNTGGEMTILASVIKKAAIFS